MNTASPTNQNKPHNHTTKHNQQPDDNDNNGNGQQYKSIIVGVFRSQVSKATFHERAEASNKPPQKSRTGVVCIDKNAYSDITHR
eukprot:m.20149 g.20149  ORF g.20149 m.20149 type:complete len:85 (+) comp12759_c0_seq1:7-261(+)